MPAAGDAPGSLVAKVMRRWQAVDPLLPDPAAPAAGCGAGLVVTGPGGEPAAVGACEHWAGPTSLTWPGVRRAGFS